ncbi:hypothetical protein BCIN_03g03170 [Botrytis cinerea B05.10]|uniref:Uncharacterized protein n=1 Tax=Botryotinia fuckeliana (strain B05.10) TaxID=332648 RepID=A0A384JC34_BOTFB|nr:hypothetical protein BCIN_03g03170 [Botrytis cinerea B05.10]ATZ48060.1 hypothetical protein BCIN_03g03170 [Botrytis cinerea B05.10]
MTDTNTESLRRQQQIMIQARLQRMQMMAAQQQQQEQQKDAMKANIKSNCSDNSSINLQSQSQMMGTAHDDLPFQPADMIFIDKWFSFHSPIHHKS